MLGILQDFSQNMFQQNVTNETDQNINIMSDSLEHRSSQHFEAPLQIEDSHRITSKLADHINSRDESNYLQISNTNIVSGR